MNSETFRKLELAETVTQAVNILSVYGGLPAPLCRVMTAEGELEQVVFKLETDQDPSEFILGGLRSMAQEGRISGVLLVSAGIAPGAEEQSMLFAYLETAEEQAVFAAAPISLAGAPPLAHELEEGFNGEPVDPRTIAPDAAADVALGELVVQAAVSRVFR